MHPNETCLKQSVRLTCATVVDSSGKDRLHGFSVQGIAFSMFDIVIDDSPDSKVVIMTACLAEEAEVSHMLVSHGEGARSRDEDSECNSDDV